MTEQMRLIKEELRKLKGPFGIVQIDSFDHTPVLAYDCASRSNVEEILSLKMHAEKMVLKIFTQEGEEVPMTAREFEYA